MKTHLVTFATSDFAAAQRRQAESANDVGGIDEVVLWDSERWSQQDFFRQHRDLASRQRGAGYWLWKPFIILKLLETVAKDDVVIYADVGRGRGGKFTTSVAPLVDWVRASRSGFLPGCYLPEGGTNGIMTKRDCFFYMQCDEQKYWDHCQIQATFSVWRPTELALTFLREWLAYCSDPRVVTDDPNTCGLPNLEGFREHRHDQSILTNLTLKHEIACYGDPSEGFARDIQKDINFLVARISNNRRLRAEILFREKVRHYWRHPGTALSKIIHAPRS